MNISFDRTDIIPTPTFTAASGSGWRAILYAPLALRFLALPAPYLPAHTAEPPARTVFGERVIDVRTIR